MKKTKHTAMIAAAFAAALSMTACGSGAAENNEAPDITTVIASENVENPAGPAAAAPDENPDETPAGESGDEFDPSSEEPQEVYGPPEWFDSNAEDEDEIDSEADSEIDSEDDYEPQEDHQNVVYGPPDDYDPSSEEQQKVYGPPTIDDDDSRIYTELTPSKDSEDEESSSGDNSSKAPAQQNDISPKTGG